MTTHFGNFSVEVQSKKLSREREEFFLEALESFHRESKFELVNEFRKDKEEDKEESEVHFNQRKWPSNIEPTTSIVSLSV